MLADESCVAAAAAAYQGNIRAYAPTRTILSNSTSLDVRRINSAAHSGESLASLLLLDLVAPIEAHIPVSNYTGRPIACYLWDGPNDAWDPDPCAVSEKTNDNVKCICDKSGHYAVGINPNVSPGGSSPGAGTPPWTIAAPANALVAMAAALMLGYRRRRPKRLAPPRTVTIYNPMGDGWAMVRSTVLDRIDPVAPIMIPRLQSGGALPSAAENFKRSGSTLVSPV
eukprot:TRINITY_DN2084_c0_g1_i2.p1 TRINITY_DN2084_c0_g1~~TRINITY_DN2084_c0_g1_i2.p1  ORF type:complete len:226 (+),score=40.75 TRINITY_DN2084_c0_g1_i2:543-1220(+)